MARATTRVTKARARRRAASRPAAPHPAAATPAAAPSALLQALKRTGSLTIRKLAADLGITYEAVRQQIAELVRAGWVTARRAPPAAAGAGGGSCGPRPGPASRQYQLSAAAEHLFPKHYEELSAELLRHLLERFGGAGPLGVLARMTDARVARWAPPLEGLSLAQKLKALCSLYEDKDAYMEVEWKEGGPALIEHNCPFLSVAQQHPAICSVSVNTLERLLGFKVVREQSFQAGHGRCVFRVRPGEPRPQSGIFTLEHK